MPRRNLVLPRVGLTSLHATWLQASEPRNWDLRLCPYQAVPDSPTGSDVQVGEVIPGPKWTGLRQLLNEWEGWRAYERIWLPDDDIYASQDTINRMFETAGALSFDLCAPALQESSCYAHYSAMRNRRCVARRTGFVEIMVPCFSAKALARLLPTLDLSSTGWGWGLDSLWPKRLEYQRMGIIDATPVLHTRPVGNFRDAALGARVHAESDRIMAEHACGQVHTTFDALGPDFQPLAQSSEALTALLVDGWSYLYASNPAVLPWIVESQKPMAGWASYPIAGTPSCGAW